MTYYDILKNWAMVNIYGSEKDRNWTQVMGKSKNYFYNPVLQNKGHIKALTQIFGKVDNIYSIIVFGDKSELRKIDIESDNIKVINESNLYSTITSYEEEVLSYKEIRGYWNDLLDTMRGVRQDNSEHVKKVKETIKESSRICL